MKRITAILILILILVFLVPKHPVNAQSTVVFDQMAIEIWPEYDRSDVLVIYRITLDASTTLPVQISLTLPREAGTPYNVAMQDLDGLLYNLPYNTEVLDDSQKITFTTPSVGLQIEYYDPKLIKDGANRQFAYVFDSEYPINNLSISIQQPINATNMIILPSFGAGVVKEDGLTYFTNDIGEVGSGTHISVQMSYTKPDDQLSVGLQPVQPSQPLSSSSNDATSAMDILPWILGGIGIVLISGGIIWFVLTRNKTGTVGTTRKRRRAAVETLRVESTDEAIYCHQCGKRASPGDIFCRTCGARLRS
jgi:hypothetical protein